MATRFDDWEGDFLAHHGIRGQKWGVRRFQNPDGSLTALGKAHYGLAEGGSNKMSRQFNRQLKKLNRLHTKTDIDAQQALSNKYKKRAAIGAGVTAGLAAATVGSHFKTAKDNLAESKAWKATHDIHEQEQDWALRKMQEGIRLPGGIDDATYGHLKNVFNQHGNMARYAFQNSQSFKNQSTFGTAKVNTRTKVLAGATAAAAGYTAYAAIRSKVAKARTTDKGHAKAVEKYKQQYSKMMNQFANTPYAELVKKQRKNVR